MKNFNFDVENAPVNVESQNVKSTNGRGSKKKGTAPVYLVLNSARAQFKKQVEHNTETKRKCIENNISKYYADPLRFWLDFKNETKVLLDSMEFNGYCNEIGLNPEDVAQHVVFEGKTIRNMVRDNGPKSVLGEQVMMFNAPLYVDAEGLYRKQITDGSENRQTENAETVKIPVEKPMA